MPIRVKVKYVFNYFFLLFQAPVEEAAPVINEPVILDPVIPEQPDLAPLPGLEPVPIAPEPQPQPTPSVDDLPLDDTYGM